MPNSGDGYVRRCAFVMGIGFTRLTCRCRTRGNEAGGKPLPIAFGNKACPPCYLTQIAVT